MHAEVAGSQFSLDAPTPAPKIRVMEGDIGDRWSLEAAVIEVENEWGEFAQFWVSVRVEKGRPKVYLTTKIGRADDRKQIQKSVQGTFNLRDSGKWPVSSVETATAGGVSWLERE